MFKKMMLSVVLLSSMAGAQGVNLHLNVPPQNRLADPSMWSVTISNTGRETIQVYIYGEVKESGRPVARGRTHNFKLPPNSTYQLRPPQIKVIVDFVDRRLANGLRRGVVPEGNYVFCVYAMDMSNRTLGSDCQSIRVTHSRTIQLISPADGETLFTDQRPVFTWAPLILPGGESIRYGFRLTEIRPGQTPTRAMNSNAPLFQRSDLLSTTLQYPTNAPALSEGNSYAWQVTARTSSSKMIGKSEVWSFTIAQNRPPIVDTTLIRIYRDSLCRSVDMNTICCSEWRKIASRRSIVYYDENHNEEYDAGIDPLILWEGGGPWGGSPATYFLGHPPCNALWVSNNTGGSGPHSGLETYFAVFNLNMHEDSMICGACMEFSADSQADVYLNGHLLGHHTTSWFGISHFIIPPSFFIDGTNILKIQIRSNPSSSIGAIFCLHYCVGENYRRDNVLRVDKTVPGDCGCLCCSQNNQSCEIKVHVTDRLGRCRAQIDPSTARLDLFAGETHIFSGTPTWMPDFSDNRAGWFVISVPWGELCSSGTRLITARFQVRDDAGNSLVPEPVYEWSFMADASPPHISFLYPVCASCNERICHVGRAFPFLGLYIDDACNLDTNSLSIRITTSRGEDFSLEWRSRGVIAWNLGENARVLGILLTELLSLRHYDWIDIRVTVCDDPGNCMVNDSTCNCRTCKWRLCDLDLIFWHQKSIPADSLLFGGDILPPQKE